MEVQHSTALAGNWVCDCTDLNDGEALAANLREAAAMLAGADLTVTFKNLSGLAERGSEFVLRVLDRDLVGRGRRTPLSGRELELLVVLATRNGPISRDEVGSIMWPLQPTQTAADFAKVYVSRLRKRLGADADIVATTPAGYCLTRALAFDLDAVESEVKAFAANPLGLVQVRRLETLYRKVEIFEASLTARSLAHQTIRPQLARIHREVATQLQRRADDP